MKNSTSFKQIVNWCNLVLISFSACAYSCESQSLDNDHENRNNVPAMVVYEGDPSVDGCGWLVQHAQNSYSPVNLNADFKIDSLKVILSYRTLESTWNCGWRVPGYIQIEILQIKKK